MPTPQAVVVLAFGAGMEHTVGVGLGDSFMVMVQVIAALALAVMGMLAARGLTRRGGTVWLVGIILPLLAVAVLIVGRRIPRFEFVWPFSWVTRTEVTYLLMAFLVPLLFVTLLPRLRTRGQKVAVAFLMVVMTAYYGLVPVVAPWAASGWLRKIKTMQDGNGVCQQSYDFTCGPAAAVTALDAVGVKASEGDLALAAKTAPLVGTDGRDLARAINKLYGAQGVEAEYCWIGRDLKALAAARPVVVSMKGVALNFHYVTVLRVEDVPGEGVAVGDPLNGRRVVPQEDFLREWAGSGIVVRRKAVVGRPATPGDAGGSNVLGSAEPRP